MGLSEQRSLMPACKKAPATGRGRDTLGERFPLGGGEQSGFGAPEHSLKAGNRGWRENKRARRRKRSSG